jgi:hypothetical protein
MSILSNFGRLEIDCTFDDIEKDASEVIALKEQAHSSMSIFLEQNTMSFFKYIDFPQAIFFNNENIADDPIAQREFLMNIEIKNIKWAMNILTFEEMSEEEEEK